MIINYFGTAKLLDLAKKCKKLLVFCQISTAYCNCDQVGAYIEEKIYNRPGENVAEKVDEIMKMSDQ